MKRVVWKAGAVVALAVAYAISGKLGLSLAFLNASATAVWPPTGLALASLLVWGEWLWPGVLLGAFVVNLTTQGNTWTALAIALGNTLEALAGTWLVRRWAEGPSAFERASTVIRFIVGAALLSTIVSATMGVTSLSLGGFARGPDLPEVWLTWWLGDAVSDLSFAPFLIVWLRKKETGSAARYWTEVAGLALVLGMVGQLVFLSRFPVFGGAKNPLGYLSLIPLVWGAIRFEQRGAVTTALVMSGLALWGTLHRVGPFVTPDTNVSLLLLQAYIGTTTITALVLAAVTAERTRAEERLQLQFEQRRQAEEGRRQSEERFRLAASSDVLTLYEQDLDLRYTWLYPAHPEHAGALGKTDADIVPGPEGEQLMEWKRAVIASGQSRQEEVRASLPSGVHYYAMSIGPRRGDTGQIIGVAGAALDITARVQAEQTLRDSEERFHGIIDNSPAVIYLKDRDGRYLLVNRRHQQLFGYSSEQLAGKTVFDLFPKPVAEYLARNDRAVVKGETPIEIEEVVLQADGPHTFISIKFPLRRADGEIYGVAGISTDITERKRAEVALQEAQERLARANQELESRVEERTASLREALQQMEEFSYTVSHDLRAPLRGMHGYSTAVLEEHAAALAPEAVGHLQRIADNALRLDKLILDVLSFTRVSRTELPLEPVSLTRIVADVIRHYPALQPPRALIESEPLLEVIGHEPTLTQIVSNLLVNAVKFVPAEVHPRVRIWTELRRDQVRLWIEDNGIGIPPQYQHRLFKMFEQLHPNFKRDGTGVGLAIVRKAVERMGGQAGVESDGVRGSRFWVQLRAASVEPDVQEA